VPTAAALAIADSARQMQAGAEQLSRGLAHSRETTIGTVRITTSQVAASYLLPRVLVELQAIEPGIEVELVASNQVSNLLQREADIAVRMVRPVQQSLLTRKMADIPITAAAHDSYLKRAGTSRRPEDLRSHRLIGYDRDDTIRRGFAAMSYELPESAFRVRTDDQLAYGRLLAARAGIGFVAAYNVRQWPRVQTLLPMLKIPPMPCWLAVHREIRGSALVRRVFDSLAEAVPRELASG
jgi:DNA-binding transcriptional LysR family regulator